MVIKKYQARTENDAVEQAKKELGPNVVVMSVRKIKKKGLFAFLKSQMVEVTVALEDDTDRSTVRRESPPREGVDVLVQDKVPVSLPRESILPRELVRSTMEAEQPRREESEKTLEKKLDSLQSFLEMQLGASGEEKKESGDDEAVTKEKEKDETAAFMQLLYSTMVENEVDETYARQIVDEIERGSKANLPIDYLLSNVYQKLILKFGKPMAIQPAQNGPKVLFFIGPTGVGKTTTIAKIASRFKVDQKKKIALLTADTYRIAATEQLRTYAGILESPFRVIYGAEEIEAALSDFAFCDYILVDTAGHSHRNEAQRDNMEELIHYTGERAEMEVFLVVSATTKYRDLLSIAEAYEGIAELKLIFTKLDETDALGNLLNLKLHMGVPLSYVTCGQNVPDDIERFNPQVTVKSLLGGKEKK